MRREGSIGCGGEQVSWQGEGIILSGTFFLEEENFSVGFSVLYSNAKLFLFALRDIWGLAD